MEEYKPELHNIISEDELKPTEENLYIGCSLCDGGYIEDGKMCECMKKEIKMRLYKNANVDYDYASLELIEEEITAYLKDDDYKHPTNPKKNGKIPILLNPFIDDYVDNADNYFEDGKGIIFAGPVGRGKSLSAMKILMKLVDKRKTGFFITIKELFEMIKKSWNDEDFVKLKNHIYNCDFLVLDDLGTEYKKKDTQGNESDWSLTELDALMRHRYYKKLPLIITTNSPLEKLEAKYAQRIISLFHERSLIVPVVSEADYRKKLSKAPSYMNHNKFMKEVD